MSRYFSAARRVRSGWDGEYPLLPNLVVPDHEPVDTGLLDHRGDPIFRAPNQVGFHNPRERA